MEITDDFGDAELIFVEVGDPRVRNEHQVGKFATPATQFSRQFRLLIVVDGRQLYAHWFQLLSQPLP